MTIDKNHGALLTLGVVGLLAAAGAVVRRKRGSGNVTTPDGAYEYGVDRGFAAAENQDEADVVAEFERQNGYPPETAEDMQDAWRDAAHEAEQHGRSYTPFEHYAHDMNSSPDSEYLWERFEEGVSDGITEAIETMGIGNDLED